MQFEDRLKNDKPSETSSKSLPMAVLLVLIGVICLLLFIGWQYLADTPSNAEEMVPTQPDAVASTMDKEQGTTDEDIDMTLEENTATATSPTATQSTLPSTSDETTPTQSPTVAVPKVDKPAPVAETSSPAAVPSGGQSHAHMVAAGETFFSIASRYGLSTESLKTYNPTVTPEAIKVGVTKLKVPIQGVHTVGPGDILRVVADKYGVTLQALMKANGKSKNHAQRGEQLIIPISKN